jgi:hypothetical protein
VPRPFSAAFAAFAFVFGKSFPDSLQILPGAGSAGAATGSGWGIVAGCAVTIAGAAGAS